MGCLFSKEDKGSRYAVGGETEDGNAAPARKPTSSTKPDAKTEPLIAKPKLDPKDFIYVKRTGEKLVKAPGTINGQQFVIDSCEDCEIYILDECDSLMIDDCVRCKIVVYCSAACQKVAWRSHKTVCQTQDEQAFVDPAEELLRQHAPSDFKCPIWSVGPPHRNQSPT